MSTTGLEVFDKTLQTTNIWLKDIMDELGPDRHVAYRALRAVLHALRDRLIIDEVAQLGAQLPLLVRGIYYDQWDPTARPLPLRSQAEFLTLIAASLADIRPVDPEVAAHAVFRVLEERIGGGEIAQVKAELPHQIRALWP